MTESTLPTGSLLAAIITEARRRGRRRKVALAAGGRARSPPRRRHLGRAGAERRWRGSGVPRPAGLSRRPGAGACRTPGSRDLDLRRRLSASISQQGQRGLFGRRARSGTIGRGNVEPLPRLARTAASRATTLRRVLAFQQSWPRAARDSPSRPTGRLDKSRFTRQPGIADVPRPPRHLDRAQAAWWVRAAYPGDGERIGLDPRTHEPVADRVYSDGKINLGGAGARTQDLTSPRASTPSSCRTRSIRSARGRPRRSLRPAPIRSLCGRGERSGKGRSGWANASPVIVCEQVYIGSTFDPAHRHPAECGTVRLHTTTGTVAIMEFSFR